MFLYMEAASCGFVNLGPALALCEKEHPQLPVTFARMFLHGLGRCFRIYDDRDAGEHLSMLEDNYDPEEGREALPDRKKLLPPCMDQRPLRGAALRTILGRMAPRNRVLRLLNAAFEVDRISRRVRLPVIPEPIREMFCDCNLPLPILLAIYQQGDAIEACFDDESKSMLELTPEPWPLIPFDGTDSISTDRAFRCLKGALDALVAARRVLDLVPGWEPIRREE
jgi:hypothetical protein